MVRGALTAMRRAPYLLSVFALALVSGATPAGAGEYPPPEPAAAAAHRVAAKPHSKKPQAKKRVAAKPARVAKPTPLPRPAPQPKAASAEPAKDVVPKPGAPKGDIAKAAASAAAPEPFAGIPPAERLRIQSALFWSGDYTGAAGGEDPMRAAIKNFQKRIKDKVTGVLTPAERERLVAAARDHERQFGWNVVVDPATGIRIGLPTRLVPQAHDAARGTRWSSAHGEVQV